MSVDITAVPSKFVWRTSPRKRPPLSARFSPKKGKHRLEESFTVSSDITSEADNTVSLETAVFRFPLGLRNCIARFGCYVAAYRQWFFQLILALLRWKSCRRWRSLSRWSAPCKFRRNCGDVYTHLLSSKTFFDFAFTKMQSANFCNFRQFEFSSNVSSNLLQPLSSKVWIFRKIEEADSFSVGVYGSSLVAKRNTAINIWTRTHPQWN